MNKVNIEWFQNVWFQTGITLYSVLQSTLISSDTIENALPLVKPMTLFSTVPAASWYKQILKYTIASTKHVISVLKN